MCKVGSAGVRATSSITPTPWIELVAQSGQSLGRDTGPRRNRANGDFDFPIMIYTTKHVTFPGISGLGWLDAPTVAPVTIPFAVPEFPHFNSERCSPSLQGHLQGLYPRLLSHYALSRPILSLDKQCPQRLSPSIKNSRSTVGYRRPHSLTPRLPFSFICLLSCRIQMNPRKNHSYNLIPST